MHTCSMLPLAKQASQQVQYVDLGPGAWQKCWKMSITIQKKGTFYFVTEGVHAMHGWREPDAQTDHGHTQMMPSGTGLALDKSLPPCYTSFMLSIFHKLMTQSTNVDVKQW
jgi:hypothetical protein